MKKIFHLMVIFLVSNSVSCQSESDYVKVEKESINKEKVEFAKNLSEMILTAQKNGKHYSLSENEATKKMINGLNETVQKKSYRKIKKLFGDYKSLQFESLIEKVNEKEFQMYRFKGFFESNLDIEVRTVLNKDGKLAGFFVRPWREKL